MAGIGMMKKMPSIASGANRQNEKSTPLMAPEAPTAE